MSGRRRLDAEVVRRHLAEDLAEANDLIAEGKVLVGGAPADNAARQVSAAESVTVLGPTPRFVGRGGEKLEAALDHFEIDVFEARALDVGASTGGFTDCLLQRGAAHVVALDVGHSQLHERIRAADRVEVMERTNIRHVTKSDFDDQAFELIVVDVSFISLRTIASVIADELALPGANLVTLIKPQFEAGHEDVSKGRGVIRDVSVWDQTVSNVLRTMADNGAATMGLMKSPLLGAEGNVEFLAWFRAHQEAQTVADVLAGVDIKGLLA